MRVCETNGMMQLQCRRTHAQRTTCTFVTSASCAREPNKHVRQHQWTHFGKKQRVIHCASTFDETQHPYYDAAGIPVDILQHHNTLWTCLHEKCVDGLSLLFTLGICFHTPHAHLRPEAFPAAVITTLQQLTAACTHKEDYSTEAEPSRHSSGVHEEASEIMYIWALAEAYCMHPLLQETMRYVLDGGGYMYCNTLSSPVTPVIMLKNPCSTSIPPILCL